MSAQPEPLSHYLNLKYPFSVVPDEGSYFIEFPDLPNCMTQVEDASEIAAMAEEIRTLWIESEYERGNSIPEPAIQSEYSGKFVVRMPKRLHRELAASAQREGTSLNAYVTYLLAERQVAASIGSQIEEVRAEMESITNRHSTPHSQGETRSEQLYYGRRNLRVVYPEAVAV